MQSNALAPFLELKIRLLEHPDCNGEEPAGSAAIAGADNAERLMSHIDPTIRANAGQTMAGRY